MLSNNNSAIDSLQLRIDLSYVNFTDEGKNILLEKYCLVAPNTGELIEDSLKHQAYKHNERGITSRFLIRKLGHNQKGKAPKISFEELEKKIASIQEKSETNKKLIHKNDSDIKKVKDEEDHCCYDLEMIINSKMLKGKYSEGITKKNIKRIYKYIISLGLFTLSFEDFLKHSRCTDIDIKTDLKNYDTDKVSDFFTGLNIIAPSQAMSINPNKEMVLQYGFRRNEKRIINNPFIKMYHKLVELKNNSNEFYREHLKRKYGFIDSFDNYFKDVLRVEGTIKNKEHFKSLLKSIDVEYKGNSLDNLLSLTESNLNSIISSLLKKHIKASEKVLGVEKLNQSNSQKQELKLADKNTILAIKCTILEGGTLDQYIYHNSIHLGKTARYNFKKKANDLYTKFLINDSEITQKNEFRETLNALLNMA